MTESPLGAASELQKGQCLIQTHLVPQQSRLLNSDNKARAPDIGEKPGGKTSTPTLVRVASCVSSGVTASKSVTDH